MISKPHRDRGVNCPCIFVTLLHTSKQGRWFHVSHEFAGIRCRLSLYEALYIDSPMNRRPAVERDWLAGVRPGGEGALPLVDHLVGEAPERGADGVAEQLRQGPTRGLLPAPAQQPQTTTTNKLNRQRDHSLRLNPPKTGKLAQR